MKKPDTASNNTVTIPERSKIVLSCDQITTKSPPSAPCGRRIDYAQDAAVNWAKDATREEKTTADEEGGTGVATFHADGQAAGTAGSAKAYEVDVAHRLDGVRTVQTVNFKCAAIFLFIFKEIVEIIPDLARLNLLLVHLVVGIVGVPCTHAHAAARR